MIAKLDPGGLIAGTLAFTLGREGSQNLPVAAARPLGKK